MLLVRVEIQNTVIQDLAVIQSNQNLKPLTAQTPEMHHDPHEAGNYVLYNESQKSSNRYDL